MKKFIGYLNDVVAELKKVVWPSKDSLISSTIVVVVVSIFFAMYIFGVDKVLNNIVGLILKN